VTTLASSPAGLGWPGIAGVVLIEWPANGPSGCRVPGRCRPEVASRTGTRLPVDGRLDSTPLDGWARLVGVETIALADGDLHWVFPELEDADEVLDVVRKADAEVRLLAEHLGVRPSWTGSGIEFHRLPSGPTSLFGSVEADGVSFVLELAAWDQSGYAAVGPPWIVDGEVAVRCDRPIDCGMHTVEQAAARQCASPADAAQALADVATWLRQRGVNELLASWRRRDERRGYE
jgi:hypothetical protein